MKTERHRWDAVALAVVGACLLLLWRVRAHLPVFYDSWYHLSVVRAFFERGFTVEAWWEFAPVGRPHLYPPLFHLTGVAVLNLTGGNLLDLGRWSGVVTFPLLLLAGWGAARSLFGPRAACVALLLLAGNLALLFPCALIMMPGTWAVALWPFVFVLLLRRQVLLAGLVLAVVGWLHFGIGTLAVGALAVFAGLRREFGKPVAVAVAVGAALFCPWLAHLWQHREFLGAATGRLPVFIPVLTLFGGALGIVAVARRREPAALAVLAMLAATGVLFFTTRDKFWIYGGFFLALLGGYGVDRCLAGQLRWAVAMVAGGSVWLTPFLRPATMQLALPIPGQQSRWWLGTPVATLAHWQRADVAAQIPPAVPEALGGLAHWITQHVGRDEILVTDDPLLGGALFALTGRRTSWGMWGEVMTPALETNLAAFRQTGGRYVVGQRDHREGLTVVAEFGRYVIYRRADRE